MEREFDEEKEKSIVTSIVPGFNVSEEQYDYIMNMVAAGELDYESMDRIADACATAFDKGDERVPSSAPSKYRPVPFTPPKGRDRIRPKLYLYQLTDYLGVLDVSPEQSTYLCEMYAYVDDKEFARAIRYCIEAFACGDERVPSPESTLEFVRVRIPASFVHPYVFTAKDGRTFDKAYVSLPRDTVVRGVSVGGYSCDIFLNDYQKHQMLLGGDVTLRFRADEPVPVWTGRKGDERHPYRRIEVSPWDLASGIKSEYEAFKERKAAERQEGSPSLRQEAEEQPDSPDAADVRASVRDARAADGGAEAVRRGLRANHM